MDTIRICVYDKEEAFASRLAVMLNRNGSGRYKVSAFDDLEQLRLQIEKKGIHIFVGDCEEVIDLLEQASILYLHLAELEEENISDRRGQSQISKYAGAKEICQAVGRLAAAIYKCNQDANKIVAMYSPVGRCGKTQFALSLGNDDKDWFYIGLEDYGVVTDIRKENGNYSLDNTFIFYIKERNTDKLLEIMEDGTRVIPSMFSPMDSKTLNEEDWKWVVEFFRKQKICKGVVFDIGTGILKDIRWLNLFDCVLVPFLLNEMAIRKKEKWEHLLSINGADTLSEKCIYINMSKTEEIEEQRKRLQNVTAT